MLDKEIRNSERIQRIMGILRLDGREVELHLPYYIEVAKISAATQDSFTLRLSNPLINLEKEHVEHVYINFVFSGVELFGTCAFIEQSKSFITLGYPESLKTRTKRRHPRARPNKGIPAELSYREASEIKAEKISSRDIPVKYSQLYWEAQRDTVDIKKIFLMGIKEVKSISPHTELVLYNKDNMYSSDARLMRKSGKVLYIDDCNNTQSYTRLIPSDKIITYSYVLTESKERGSSREELLQALHAVIKEDRVQGYTSKVLIPLLSHDKVIGHIKVIRRGEEGKITGDEVSNLMVLCKLIGLGVEKARYIPNLSDIFSSNLVNISEGGMLLKIESHAKGVIIPEGVNIEVRFLLKGKEVALKGNVCRSDFQEQLYAIKFSDVSPEDRKVIKYFVEENIAKFHETK